MRKRDELERGCMAKARDDEVTFVLLDRDDAAPATVRWWVGERIRLGLNRPGDAKMVEAEHCAQLMEAEHARMAGPARLNPPGESGRILGRGLGGAGYRIQGAANND